MEQTRRDHRVKVTRMLIQKAFTQLVRQKPLQSISIKELCELAGINRGTFYAHYRDLYDLREQMEQDMMQDFEQALQPLFAAKTEDLTPLKITTQIFQCIKDNADICAVTLGPYGDKEFAAKIINIGRERCIASYSAYFLGTSHTKLEFFYAFVSAGCIGLLEKWLDEGMSTSVEELAQISEGLMMQGIAYLRV